MPATMPSSPERSAPGQRVCRCFIAAPIPQQLKQELGQLQARLDRHLTGVRWTRPEALHITLRFLGDQPEDSLERLGNSMLSVGRLNRAFDVCCHGVGAFPSLRRGRVIWAGFAADTRWRTLHQELTRQLEICGIPPEQRPFSPHLTLGRVRGRPLDLSQPLTPLAETRCGQLTVDRIILFESRLRPDGAIHLPRKTVRLTGDDISCHTALKN